MRDADDWRLAGQERFLLRARFRWQQFRPSGGPKEPGHCAFCYVGFTAERQPNTLIEGFVTLDGLHWVCQPCFQTFRERFHWEVVGPLPPD